MHKKQSSTKAKLNMSLNSLKTNKMLDSSMKGNPDTFRTDLQNNNILSSNKPKKREPESGPQF
jgi:hypothetical protein